MMNLDDLDGLVEESDPASSATIPAGSSAEARWRYLQLTSSLPPSVRVRPRRARNVALIAALASGLVLLLVNVIPGSSGPKSAAAATLDQAAVVAGEQTPLAPGQYMYVETQSSYQVSLYNPTGSSQALSATAQFDETDQAWTTTTTGQLLKTDSLVQFPSPEDKQVWNANPLGPSMLLQIDHFSENGGRASAQQSPLNVADLPLDPAALEEVISNGQMGTNINHIPAGPNATFERTAILLLGPTAGMSPPLASALFQVLAAQPGVQLMGMATDHEGQTGQAVELAAADGLSVSKVIVDPTTGSLLEAQFALPASKLPLSDASACSDPAGGTGATPSCRSAGGESILAPVWTDVVAKGVVASDNATLPSAGDGVITASLVPEAPTELTVTSENGQVVLAWNAPKNTGEYSSPVTDYVVYEYTNGQTIQGGPSAVIDTHSITTECSLPLNRDQASPTYTVQAVNAYGYGVASVPVTVNP